MFDRDDWAPEVMYDHCPTPRTPEGCNEVFDRMAAQFREAIGFPGVRRYVATVLEFYDGYRAEGVW